MIERLRKLDAYLADLHANLTANTRRLPTVGSLFDRIDEKWERQAMEQHRRVKALDATDEG